MPIKRSDLALPVEKANERARQKIFSVSELTSSIKCLLEPNFRAISVRGEISNFKMQSSGHLYFSLKDSSSQISAALFKGSVSGLSRLPKEGDQVIAIGNLSVYAPRGNYQMIVSSLEFLGVGELLLQLHQRKELLQKRGWFDPSCKKPLPKLPQRIGVVTSPTGAVIRDIIHVLTRRFSGLQIILNPVKVQGEGASLEIAQAIDEMNRFSLADVLIVGRGGGSIEDLWAFNEEIVAKSIFESLIPIISAVGHETDFTIADLVADVRAPTPSAAAEIAIGEKASLLKSLETFRQQSARCLFAQIEKRQLCLGALLKHPVIQTPQTLLAPFCQKLDEITSTIQQLIQRRLDTQKTLFESIRARLFPFCPSRQISSFQEQLQRFKVRFDQAIFYIIEKKTGDLKRIEAFARIQSHIERLIYTQREMLEKLSKHFESVHPKNLLKKGYSILFSEKNNSIILSARDIKPDESFKAILSDGTIHAIAKETTPNL